ncbi:hypothetical protein GCM10023093_26190 [Nemorincola caseinilytica]|uniref:Uncharacterized protein n=1 Tax=Nemorincola caseinilytica TaxID=2054315 RepID=A0ABP8NJQ7_9BACT
MKRLKSIAMYVLLSISLGCAPNMVQAQGFEEDVDDEDVSNMPLDGGVTLLAAGGFVYILKRMSVKKNDKEEDLGLLKK